MPTLTPTSQVSFAHYNLKSISIFYNLQFYHLAHSIGQNVERRIWAQVSFRDPYLSFCIFSYFFPFLLPMRALYNLRWEEQLFSIKCSSLSVRWSEYFMSKSLSVFMKPPNCKNFLKIKPWLPKLGYAMDFIKRLFGKSKVGTDFEYVCVCVCVCVCCVGQGHSWVWCLCRPIGRRWGSLNYYPNLSSYNKRWSWHNLQSCFISCHSPLLSFCAVLFCALLVCFIQLYLITLVCWKLLCCAESLTLNKALSLL